MKAETRARAGSLLVVLGTAALMAACGGGGGSSGAGPGGEVPSMAAPAAWGLVYREKMKRGWVTVGNKIPVTAEMSERHGIQLLLVDLEQPERTPVVLDAQTYARAVVEHTVTFAGSLPQHVATGFNTGVGVLVPQKLAGAAGGRDQQFDRYFVHAAASGRLLLLDLAKSGTQPPVPRFLSRLRTADATIALARFDAEQPDRSFIACTGCSLDGVVGTYYVQPAMGADDAPLTALPAVPSIAFSSLPGVDPDRVFAEDGTALYASTGGLPSSAEFALERIDKASAARTVIRPDLGAKIPVNLRWPYTVAFGGSATALDIYSIDLSNPSYPAVLLEGVRYPYYQLARGLDRTTLVTSLESGSEGREQSRVIVRRLDGGTGSQTFAQSLFVGWNAAYRAGALGNRNPDRGFLNFYSYQSGAGYPFSPGHPPFDGTERRDGLRTAVPTHLLLASSKANDAALQGASIESGTVVPLGALPSNLAFAAYADPAWSAVFADAWSMYAGKWVLFKAFGTASVPCDTVAPWMEANPRTGVVECSMYFSDVLLADPATSGSLRRITDQATSRF